MAAADPISMLRARLTEARAALLGAVTGLTERDFAAPLAATAAPAPAETVIGLLAALVASEYAAVRDARAALATLEARRIQPAFSEPSARVLPPQIVHGLAGSRRETTLLLDAIAVHADPVAALDSALERADDRPETTVRSLLEAIARREDEAAARIRSRPGR